MSAEDLRSRLRAIIEYPPENHPRRGEDGYPSEVTYDEFAYRRMVDSYREALESLLEVVSSEPVEG